MPEMVPKAANLGSRPARNTGESAFGQRADSDLREVMDERGVIVDVKYNKSKCRACGAIGTIYRCENDLTVCMVCSVVQNDGNPEGEKSKDKSMGNFRRALSRKKV